MGETKEEAYERRRPLWDTEVRELKPTATFQTAPEAPENPKNPLNENVNVNENEKENDYVNDYEYVKDNSTDDFIENMTIKDDFEDYVEEDDNSYGELSYFQSLMLMEKEKEYKERYLEGENSEDEGDTSW